MTIFRLPRFIRRFVRRHTNHISELQAITSRKKLSFFYAIVSWNILGYILYKVLKERENPTSTETKKSYWWEGNVYGMEDKKNIHYRVEGLKLIKVEDTNKADLNKDTNKVDLNEEESIIKEEVERGAKNLN